MKHNKKMSPTYKQQQYKPKLLATITLSELYKLANDNGQLNPIHFFALLANKLGLHIEGNPENGDLLFFRKK